jgi:hypothetical protein
MKVCLNLFTVKSLNQTFLKSFGPEIMFHFKIEVHETF